MEVDGKIRNKIIINHKFLSFIVYTLLSCLARMPLVVAQTNPQPVLPSPEPLPESEPLPPQEDIFPQPETVPETDEPSSPKTPNTIRVETFDVKGSTVFSQSKLAEVLAPFRDRALSFNELLKAKQAITDLYVKNGYITSGAYIPSQSFAEGAVTIQVVEGAIGTIEIKGLEQLNASYVRNRLKLATETPLNQQKLLEALRLLQLDPLIERISAELSAGSRPGVNLLTVTVQEAPAFSTRLTFDNRRSPNVGTNRRLVELNYNNLLGIGDRISLRYYNTDGSNALDDFSYTIPINARNGTLKFRYRLTDSQVIEEPFNKLDINSNYRQYALTYRQPIVETPSQEFALGLTADRQASDTSLLNVLEGETRVFALRFFQEYTNRSPKDVFSARSQISWGLEGSEVRLNGDKTEGEFLAWRGQAQYVRQLTPDTTVLLRSQLQFADRPLVSLEQLSVGGALTVRGYRQNLLLADNGVFASAELRTPILKIPEWNTTLKLTPFFDFGTVWNRGEEAVEPRNNLSSVGLGMNLLIGENFSAEVDWGIPLAEVDTDEDTLQEQGVHFRVLYQPF